MARPTDRLTEIFSTAARTIERHRLLSGADPVLVAFSGGSDSCAAAVVLQHLGYSVVLGHVDHRMRTTSGQDAARCGLIAERLGAELRSTALDLPPPTEEAARTARYAALEKIRTAVGAEAVATGHTMDDQAETVAMRLERGGFGLGMPVRRGSVVRPLLELRRSDTEFVCREMDLDYLVDPSNDDERYTRNRIRKRLRADPVDNAPTLVALDAANRRKVEDTASQVQTLLSDIALRQQGVTRLERNALAALPDELKRALLRRALADEGVDANPRLLTDIIERVIPMTGPGLDASTNVEVWSEPGWIAIGRWSRVDLPDVVLSVPSAVSSDEWGLLVKAEVTTPPARFDPCSHVATLDLDRLPGSLTLRQRRPGDRMQVQGSSGSKKLQDLFVDLKIPRRQRDRVPVVTCGDEVVWVVGHRIAEGPKITKSTSRAVRLEVSRSMRL